MVVDSELRTDIVLLKRNYFNESVNAPLRFAIVLYGKKYPEPIRSKLGSPEAIVLYDIWEKFFTLEDNNGRNSFFQALRKISIGVIESMDYYSQRATWFLMELVQAYLDRKWPQNLPCSPYSCWKDPATIASKEETIENMVMSGKGGI